MQVCLQSERLPRPGLRLRPAWHRQRSPATEVDMPPLAREQLRSNAPAHTVAVVVIGERVTTGLSLRWPACFFRPFGVAVHRPKHERQSRAQGTGKAVQEAAGELV